MTIPQRLQVTAIITFCALVVVALMGGLLWLLTGQTLWDDHPWLLLIGVAGSFVTGMTFFAEQAKRKHY